MRNLALCCPTCDVIARHFVSFACWRINLAVVDVAGVSTILFVLSNGLCITPSKLWAPPTVSERWMTVSVEPGVTIARSGRFSLSGAAFSSIAGILESTSVILVINTYALSSLEIKLGSTKAISRE